MESSLIWAELQDKPLRPPPPGLIADLIHPESQAWKINVATYICLPLIALFAAMRLYAKAVILKKWTWDDVTCVLGLLAGVAFLILGLVVANGGVYGKHFWDLTIGEFSATHNVVLALVTESTYGPCIWFVKLSLFVLYLQVFRPLRWLRYCAIAGIVSTGLFYWTVSIVYLAMCVPRDGTSALDYFEARTSARCLKTNPLLIANGAVSLVSDLYLVILPLPAVWNLQIPFHRKLALSAMFFTGAIACICSAFALAYRVETSIGRDATWFFVPLAVVTNVEFTAGILVCCMPTTTVVFKQLRAPMSSFVSSYRRAFRTKSGSGAVDRYNLSSVTNLHSADGKGFYAINGEATHEAFDGKIRKTTDIEVRRPHCNE